MRSPWHFPGALLLGSAAAFLPACHSAPGTPAPRSGDEIMVCGRLIHTGGAPVVLWTDPGGYDAYRTEKRFAPLDKSAWTAPSPSGSGPAAPNAGNGGGGGDAGPATPNRFGLRRGNLSPDDLERIRGGGWDLSTLQRVVDQFVIHYDAAGTSRQCFKTLHDSRGLSVHFMLDLDGTIYQTLDLKERAWHATTSNDRSIGIEIANPGAYPAPTAGEQSTASGAPAAYDGPLPKPLSTWYASDAAGASITLPAWLGDGGIRTPGFLSIPPRPARPRPIFGDIQGQPLVMFDLTPQQYDSLIRLTAALCTIFPDLPCDYPRDDSGRLVTSKLPDDALLTYRGILGHFHIQQNKVDPGPAFDWDRVINGARALMRRPGAPGIP